MLHQIKLMKYKQIIFAENNLHLIGGWGDYNHHLIYNGNKEKFDQNWEFQQWITDGRLSNHYGGLVYVKSKRELLLFGGWGCSGVQDKIYRYSFDNKT